MTFLEKLNNKGIRYRNLIATFENWNQFILFKMTAKAGDAFTFKLRNAFSITVEKKMLGPFRDVFFDDKYLKHLPADRFPKKDLVVVDIGANVGYFSLFALYRFPGSRVLSFEPMPFCFNQLEKYCTTFKNPSFSVYNYAVGNIDGEIDFYVHDANEFSTDSTIHPGAGLTRLTVKSYTLKTLISTLHTGKIDLIKLDCEGAEYDILYAMTPQELLGIENITMEVHNVDKKSKNLVKMVQFLKENDFKVFHENLYSNPLGGHVWATRYH